MKRRWWWAVCALVPAAVCAGAGAQPPAPQTRPIATLDFHGQRTVDPEVLRRALPIHEGDAVTQGDAARLASQVRAALTRLPAVRDARLELVCCAQDGGVHLFVGVQEDSSPQLHVRQAPTGALRLPEALVRLDAAEERARMDALLGGHAAEDDSQGHAFAKDAPEVRARQEQRLPLASRHLALLRRVLRESADPGQRALAARFLGYAPDLQAVVGDLARAVTDPDAGVRNDAVRALVVFSRAAHPPRIPYAPFIDLLASADWTDLNKASFALYELSAGRDPGQLAQLRQRELPALVAMARWRSRDHSLPAYGLLGRIGGLSEQEIIDHWSRGDPEPVIAAALKAG